MRALVDIVFPPSCLSCGAHGARALCDRCLLDITWIGDDACRTCGRPGARTGDCRDCRWLQPAFDVARAAALYEGPARDALKAFKLGGERRAGRELAGIMLRAVPAGGYDVVTFVPATGRSLRARGFNPAEVLARALARRLQLPARALLQKVRETADQTGLDRGARRSNQEGAYAARSRTPRSVLLVDDIFTTGATVDACCRALGRGGTTRMAVLTFARAR